MQATEALKLLAEFGEPLIGRLLTYDAIGMHFREVKLRKDPNCPLCGSNPTIKDLSIHMEGASEACATPDNGQATRAATQAPSVE